MAGKERLNLEPIRDRSHFFYHATLSFSTPLLDSLYHIVFFAPVYAGASFKAFLEAQLT